MQRYLRTNLFLLYHIFFLFPFNVSITLLENIIFANVIPHHGKFYKLGQKNWCTFKVKRYNIYLTALKIDNKSV